MITDRACWIPYGWITKLCTLSWDDGNWQSMTHTWGGIAILWPLPWDDDNWRSIFHTIGLNNHVLSVVIRRWQLTEHVSSIMDILPCSYRCYETMTTDGACFILEGYTCITMLWPLSWDDINRRSIIYTLWICNHALSFVMRRWQLTKHVSYIYDILPCSDRCHETITTDGACLNGWITMLCPLSGDDDNWRSMFHT